MYRIQDVSDLNEDLLILEVIDRAGKLIFNLGLKEDAGEILFRVGNSVANEPIEIGALQSLLLEMKTRLVKWADGVKDESGDWFEDQILDPRSVRRLHDEQEKRLGQWAEAVND